MSFHRDFIKHHQRLLLLLKSCSKSPCLRNTKPLHALTVTLGPNPNQPIFLCNNVISLYVSLGELSTARNVFDRMPERNVVSFNTIISAYSRSGHVEEALGMFLDMRNCGFEQTQFTFGGLLSCDLLNIIEGVQLQALVVKNGLFCADAFVGTAFLGLYGRYGFLDEAICVFEDMPRKSLVTWNSIISIFGLLGFVEDCMFLFRELIREEVSLSECSFVSVIHGLASEQGICSAEKLFKDLTIRDVVSWNTIIGALVKSENFQKALEFFLRMSTDRVLPNQTTFVYVINCCAGLDVPLCGKSIHARIIKNALECDVFVGSAFIDFYAKCDKLEDAHLCFNEISDKNVVSWNSLILGYANKCSSTCLLLLTDMFQLSYRPNEFTFSHVLRSMLPLELLQLHCLIIRMGYESNESGQYMETVELLSQLKEPDIVSWNIVISACARNGDHKEVFELFKYMRAVHIYPDSFTYVCLLSVCTKLCNLALGSSLHGLITKTDISSSDTFLCNVLIDMYGKCGCIQSSVKIFDEMTDRNVITWTALISALGLNGFAQGALEKFRQLEFLGFKPDRVAFIAVLTACRHGGLVKEGMEFFERMNNSYGIEPEMDHYHCVVDLLVRYGYLKEAEKIIVTMPFPPNALIWRAFLDGCQRHRALESHSAYTQLSVNIK